MSAIDQTVPALNNRLRASGSELLAFANTWRAVLLNALLLAVTVILLANGNQAVPISVIILLWGAVACFITNRVKVKYTGLQVVTYYACATIVVICAVMACYRLAGM